MVADGEALADNQKYAAVTAAFQTDPRVLPRSLVGFFVGRILMTIDEAVALYEKHDEELGYEDRSYGACIGVLNGVVAIADESSDNGSNLEMYTEQDFIRWMTEAEAGVASGEYLCVYDAVVNTKPEPVVADSH